MAVTVLGGGTVDPVVFLADVFMNAAADSIQYHTGKVASQKQLDGEAVLAMMSSSRRFTTNYMAHLLPRTRTRNIGAGHLGRNSGSVFRNDASPGVFSKSAIS